VDLAQAERVMTADPAATRPGADRRVVLAVAAGVLAAGGAVVAAAAFGGAARPSVLADPGAVTRWGLLLARTAHDLAAMGTLGVLAVAVLLLPTSAGALLPDAARLLRLSAGWAAAWAGAALLGFLMTLSEATALPVQDVLRADVLALGLELPQTRALLSSVWLAGLVAVWARWTRSPAGGWLLLLTAVAALLPPLITGHAAHQEEHTTAVISLALHVGTAALWAGGLVALALHLRRSPMVLQVALPRYSQMALGCFVAVALSGAVTGWTAFAELPQLWDTAYGQLLLGKVAALLVLGVAGYLHRQRTIRAVAAGRPRAFLALAVAELVLMAGAAGLAVGLSHTPPPPSADHGAVAAPAALG
jgi:putative copper export protein